MTRLDESLQPDDVRRLDRPDAAAWRGVLEHAPSTPFDDPLLEATGPFDAALHSWRAFQNPDTRGAVAERCTLDLADALEHAATTPKGFTRAALEAAWARHLHGHASPGLEDVLVWIREQFAPDPEALDLELETLALMYRSRAAMARGDTRRAEELCKEAEGRLPAEPAEPSAAMEARRLRMRWALRTGRFWNGTFRSVEEAEQRLAPTAIARRVDMLEILSYYEPTSRSRRVLHRALDLVPEGYAVHRRLTLTRDLLQIALNRFDLDETKKLLADFDALLAYPFVDPFQHVMRDWLRGRMAKQRGMAQAAWDFLRRSARGFTASAHRELLDSNARDLVDVWVALEPTSRHHAEARRLLDDLTRGVPEHKLLASVRALSDAVTAKGFVGWSAAFGDTEPDDTEPDDTEPDDTEPRTVWPAAWGVRRTLASPPAMTRCAKHPALHFLMNSARRLLPMADQLVAALAEHDGTASEPPQQAFEEALNAWCKDTEPAVSTLLACAAYFQSSAKRPSAFLQNSLSYLLRERSRGPMLPRPTPVHAAPRTVKPWVEIVPVGLLTAVVRCPSQDVAVALWHDLKVRWVVRDEDEATAIDGVLRIYLSNHGRRTRSAPKRIAQRAALLDATVEPPEPLDLSRGGTLHRAARRLRTLGLSALGTAWRLERMMGTEADHHLEALGHTVSHFVTPELDDAVERLRILSAQIGGGRLEGVVERLAAGEVTVEGMIHRSLVRPTDRGAAARPATSPEPSAEADTDTPHRVIDHTIGRIEDSEGLSSYIALADAWAQTRGARVERLPRDVWLVLADRDAGRNVDEVIRLHVPAEMDDAEVESMQETLSALAGHG